MQDKELMKRLMEYGLLYLLEHTDDLPQIPSSPLSQANQPVPKPPENPLPLTDNPDEANEMSRRFGKH